MCGDPYQSDGSKVGVADRIRRTVQPTRIDRGELSKGSLASEQTLVGTPDPLPDPPISDVGAKSDDLTCKIASDHIRVR